MLHNYVYKYSLYHLIFCYIVVRCSSPYAPSNVKRTYRGRNYNDTVNFHCKTGYLLRGSSSRTCQANGQWSGTQPTCVSKWWHTLCVDRKRAIWFYYWVIESNLVLLLGNWEQSSWANGQNGATGFSLCAVLLNWVTDACNCPTCTILGITTQSIVHPQKLFSLDFPKIARMHCMVVIGNYCYQQHWCYEKLEYVEYTHLYN